LIKLHAHTAGLLCIVRARTMLGVAFGVKTLNGKGQGNEVLLFTGRKLRTTALIGVKFGTAERTRRPAKPDPNRPIIEVLSLETP